MIYFSATSLGVRSNQDRAEANENGLIVCDGIGQYAESGNFAEFVVNSIHEQLSSEKHISNFSSYIHLLSEKSKNLKVEGGTTILVGNVKEDQQSVKMGYLGNGGIIHLKGNFFTEKISDHPYIFSNLFLPHVNKEGALTRHFSHNSGIAELKISEMELTLNSDEGDILLFFTDGISSLEDQFIIKDEANRAWRNESVLIQEVLKELDISLKRDIWNDPERIPENLNHLLKTILKDLNTTFSLEDDVSLGLIITDRVFHHYKLHSYGN